MICKMFKLAVLVCAFSSVAAFDSEPFRVMILSDTLSFEEGNAAYVSVCVQNVSEKNIFFKVFPAQYSTFQPVVYSMDGREAETRVKYRLAGRTVDSLCQPLIPRVIELAPNEKFFSKVNLNDYYKLIPGNKYRIRAFFLPDARLASVVRSENTLIVNFNKYIERTDMPQEMVRKSEIEPGEIVSLFLKAEKDKRWNSMVKYLDLEKYINVYADYGQAYNGSDDISKRSIMRDFISYLSRPRPDYVMEYDVKDEKILDDGNSALVTVDVKRHGNIMPFSYEYRFSLERSGNMWKISSSDATIRKDRKK